MAKELSLMWQLRKEADRDFSKYLKYVNEIFEENKMLHEELWKLHSLWSKDTKYIQELEAENENLRADNQRFRARLDMLGEKE